VYRILQEIISNTNKYANATRLSIDIDCTKTNIEIRTADNGIGFDVNENKNGLGLLSIKERVNALKGKLSLSSEAKKGTRYLIEIPI
jgi:two-component system, NarL family, sensor kinase